MSTAHGRCSAANPAGRDEAAALPRLDNASGLFGVLAEQDVRLDGAEHVLLLYEKGFESGPGCTGAQH